MTFKDLRKGMKVWIREDLKVGGVYGDQTFVKDMERLTGLQKITGIGYAAIKVNNEPWLFTSEMIDWEKTKKLNKKSELIYDGTILKGQIDGQEIKVVRSPEDKEDLEKAVMMGLLKSLGVTYKDVKELESKVKKAWRPARDEFYYFVTSVLNVYFSKNTGFICDADRINAGNCFKTEEEAAKKAAELRELFRR